MATDSENFEEQRSENGSEEGFYDKILNDVLEFLNDLNVHDLPENLHERYHKLQEDVKNVFYDPNESKDEDDNNDTGYGEELVDSSTPDHFTKNFDEESVDSNLVHFNNNKPSASGFGFRYPNREKTDFENDDIYDETNLNQDYEPVQFDRYDDSSKEYSLQYIDVIRLAQRSGPISMKLLMRTRKFIGVISIGRLILYREDKSNIHEKIYDTDIKLQGEDRKVDVNPDSKNDKRLNLTIVSEVDGKRKYETYEFKADDKIDRDEWVRALRNACSNDIDDSQDNYDALEITSADELEYDEFADNDSRKTSNASQSFQREFSQDDVEAVATSRVMSNLLPFEKHKNTFSSRFHNQLAQHHPEPSDDNDFFEDYDVEDPSQRPLSNQSDDIKSCDMSIQLRKNIDNQMISRQTSNESRTSQERFFEPCYYEEDRSNVSTSELSNYNSEEKPLPPPPPESELNVDFIFDPSFNGIKAFNGDRTSYTSSDCPSPLPPKHSTPIKPPPPPLPPSKSLKVKAAAPKPNEVKSNTLKPKIKTETPARTTQPPSSVLGSKSSSNISAMTAGEAKRIEPNPDAKANWGNIAAMIANKPVLKSSPSRIQRTPEAKVTTPEETELEKLMKRVAKRNLQPPDPSPQGNNKKTELLRTGSLSRPNLLSENEKISKPSLLSKPSGIQKASSFKTRTSSSSLNNMHQEEGIESELQRKLQKQCRKISDAASASQKTISEPPNKEPSQEIRKPKPNRYDENAFNSLPLCNSTTNDISNDQNGDSSQEDTDENGYMRVPGAYVPAPPTLPNKGENALPLPPKKNNFQYQEEEHYAVPKNIQSKDAPEECKPKIRSLTKPQVPNKPITMRKPPLSTKPPTLKMQTNPGTNARNRTACKAVLHTNAANKTHLKLFQPVNDAHSRIKGALRARLRS